MRHPHRLVSERIRVEKDQAGGSRRAAAKLSLSSHPAGRLAFVLASTLSQAPVYHRRSSYYLSFYLIGRSTRCLLPRTRLSAGPDHELLVLLLFCTSL